MWATRSDGSGPLQPEYARVGDFPLRSLTANMNVWEIPNAARGFAQADAVYLSLQLGE